MHVSGATAEFGGKCMSQCQEFVRDLDQFVGHKLLSLDLLRETELAPADASEVVRRLHKEFFAQADPEIFA